MSINKFKKFVPEFAIISLKKSVFLLHTITAKFFAGGFINKYDYETIEVVKKTLTKRSNWIDIGAHKGHILRELLHVAPDGKSFAFEPIPNLYKALQSKYGKKVTVSDIALSDQKGEKTFTLFVDRPAFSGFNKRDTVEEYATETLVVKVDRLDNIVDPAIKIDLIKIDVEGAEMEALRGAEKILKSSKPIILFEFGLGGTDVYNTTPEMMFDYLTDCGLVISTQENFLSNKKPFSRVEFVGQYTKVYNYFFMAYDQAKYF
ncbi:MAG TPA: FkbM family methyltransferase [Ferruginibacter sp.]|nr:FkbM family methyltransferase [Ferruginibacter sp.]